MTEGLVEITDSVIWISDIDGAEDFVEQLKGLSGDEALQALLDGDPVTFHRMRDGRDGRPTMGIRLSKDDYRRYDLIKKRGKVFLIAPNPKKAA